MLLSIQYYLRWWESSSRCWPAVQCVTSAAHLWSDGKMRHTKTAVPPSIVLMLSVAYTWRAPITTVPCNRIITTPFLLSIFIENRYKIVTGANANWRTEKGPWARRGYQAAILGRVNICLNMKKTFSSSVIIIIYCDFKCLLRMHDQKRYCKWHFQ